MTLYPNTEYKPSKKVKKCTWDIETDAPLHPEKVVLIGFYNGEKYFKFDNFDTFLGECLKRKYIGCYHYAHFGGKFDFLFLLDALKSYELEYDIIDVNGKILEINIILDKYKGKHIKFRDSFAIMPKSLKDITTSFNVAHIKKHQEFKTAYSEMSDEQKEEFKEYLEYDTKGLYEAIDHFEDIIIEHGGNLQLTIAATSLKIFKNKYLKTILNSLDVIKTDIGELDVEKLIREYYFGGRNEIFKRYINFGYYYDVNSLYPFAMLQKMPISAPILTKEKDIDFKHDTGFVYCPKIEFWNYEKIPLIPYKLKLEYSTKLIYPIGSWSGWLDLDLYRKAIDIGYEITPQYGFIFNTDYIFKDYILDFYKLRSLNPSMKLIAKLIMNSLYGKFAQKRLRKTFVKYLGTDEEILKELIPYDLDLSLFQKEIQSNSKHIIPSISAHITTLSQLILYEYLEKVGLENTYYCDTDSIITTKKLDSGKELGQLKCEWEIEKGIFLLPKTYYIEGMSIDGDKKEWKSKTVMKGYTKSSFNFDDFQKALTTGNYSNFKYEENRIFGFKESIKRTGNFTHFGLKKKSIISEYDKRILDKDRINTKPLCLINGILKQ